LFRETKTGFSNGETILLLQNHQSRIAQNDTVPFWNTIWKNLNTSWSDKFTKYKPNNL